MGKRILAPGERIKNYSTWKLIKDITNLTRPHRLRFISGTLLRFLSDISNLYGTYGLAKIITIISQGNLASSSQEIWTIVIIWSSATVFRTFSIYFAKKLIFNIGDSLEIEVEQSSIEHMFNLDIAWHEQENTGNKLKRIHTAALGYNRLLRFWVQNIIEIIVNFVGTIIIIANFDTKIALITLGFLVAYWAVGRILRKRSARASNMASIKGEEIVGLQFEALHNVRSVKIMSMIKAVVGKLRVHSDQLYQLTQKRVFWNQTRATGETVVAQVFKIFVIVIIVAGIINGQYEVGLLIIFNNYFNSVWGSISELSGVSEDILIARYNISRLKTILEVPITIDDETDKKKFPKNWETIELKNVSFAYGDNIVLKNISFTINRGEKVGIMGLSGAGKSTLYKLLLKEYENFEGDILIDGVAIQQISKRDYFKYVAVVLQETEVFNFSLRENIYLAGPGTKNKEASLQQALETAHVTDFLDKLPDGVDTAIGERGVKLSGGEKQRLGIARAVFKQPQLLLLDEATSHLDLESEEKIQDSLHKFFNSVTAIVIAHRLTTIKEMDKILVIEEGEIIESGNFAELSAKKGRFHELWEKQRL